VLGPHAIYTVSKDSLLRIREIADKTGSLIHIQPLRDEREVDDCVTQTGVRPARYLDGLGFLAKDVIAAHGCWLDPSEIELLARTGTRVAHCPTSNMKLSTGQTMPYAAMKEAAVVMGLGTDGAASNNNLDMFETMKVAALLQKICAPRSDRHAAIEAFQLANFGGARALGVDAGLIGVDRLADIIIVDPRRPELTPRHDDISNWSYSAHGNIVDTTICDGVVLMRGRRVRGEAENPRESRGGRTGSRVEGLRWPSTACARASASRHRAVRDYEYFVHPITDGIPLGRRRSSTKSSPSSSGSATGTAATKSSRPSRWASRSPRGLSMRVHKPYVFVRSVSTAWRRGLSEADDGVLEDGHVHQQHPARRPHRIRR